MCLENIRAYSSAVRFGFENKDLEAALIFYNLVSITHYNYPSIPPDMVFVKAQIFLNKISELTEYAIVLRNVKTKGAISGKYYIAIAVARSL